MNDQLSRIDVLLNQQNIALARSQRLIRSWLPPQDKVQGNTPTREESDDEDFTSTPENAGIGSTVNIDGLADGASQRAKLSSNDKLREQLFGKKAAMAFKKQKAVATVAGGGAGKSLMAGKHNLPKPMGSRHPQRSREEEGSDDEGGRAAAFTSKKRKIHTEPSVRTRPKELVMDTQTKEVDEVSGDDALDPSSVIAEKYSRTLEFAPEGEQQPTKKRVGSYLDELLAKKAGKRGKKRKQSGNG